MSGVNYENSKNIAGFLDVCACAKYARTILKEERNQGIEEHSSAGDLTQTAQAGS